MEADEVCEHDVKPSERHTKAYGLYAAVPRPRPQWRWTISRWTSQRPRWGLEIRKRSRLRHSQIRVHAGRHHWTLMAFVEAKRV